MDGMDKEKILIEVQEYVKNNRYKVSGADNDYILKEGMKKYSYLVAERSDRAENDEKDIKSLREFADENDAQRNKMYAFCYENIPDYVSRDMVQYELHRMPRDKSQIYRMAKFSEMELIVKAREYVEKHKNDKMLYEVIMEIMEAHDMKPSDVYTSVSLSRQLFSKLTDPKAKSVPKITTLWTLIIGLHCNLEEADRILNSAGYARHGLFDSIISFFVESEVYDMTTINWVLVGMGMPTLAPNVYTDKKDDGE